MPLSRHHASFLDGHRRRQALFRAYRLLVSRCRVMPFLKRFLIIQDGARRADGLVFLRAQRLLDVARRP